MKYIKQKRRLYLPVIFVDDETEDILRNLLAFEITHKRETKFRMYILIMDQLIQNEEDLAILEEANVINNHLGSSKKLVNMWKNMCIKKGYNRTTESMVKEIVADHSSSWHRWAIEFHAMLVSRPWYTVSAIAALLLLIASILQTVFTVLAYLNPKT